MTNQGESLTGPGGGSLGEVDSHCQGNEGYEDESRDGAVDEQQERAGAKQQVIASIMATRRGFHQEQGRGAALPAGQRVLNKPTSTR